MNSRKHLVLDGDVHEALSRQKALTRLPLKEIGNSILRSHSADLLMATIIGNLLVAEDLVTSAEYQELMDRAAGKVQQSFTDSSVLLEPKAGDSLTIGSWEIANILTSAKGTFQIMEYWARDTFRTPIPGHHHEGDEFLVSLRGRTIVTLRGTSHILGPKNMLQIPAGCTHSATPLDDTVHLIAILTCPQYDIAQSQC